MSDLDRRQFLHLTAGAAAAALDGATLLAAVNPVTQSQSQDAAVQSLLSELPDAAQAMWGEWLERHAQISAIAIKYQHADGKDVESWIGKERSKFLDPQNVPVDETVRQAALQYAKTWPQRCRPHVPWEESPGLTREQANLVESAASNGFYQRLAESEDPSDKRHLTKFFGICFCASKCNLAQTTSAECYMIGYTTENYYPEGEIHWRRNRNRRPSEAESFVRVLAGDSKAKLRLLGQQKDVAEIRRQLCERYR
jgi:hypothetical protein